MSVRGSYHSKEKHGLDKFSKPYQVTTWRRPQISSHWPSQSHNSLKKYMELVTKEVEKRIQSALPEKLALAIDGWTKNATHFVGVFAIYPAANTQGYDSALLAFSPLFSETSFTANDHYQFLESKKTRLQNL